MLDATVHSTAQPFTAVYGPVKSWRFGQSLGIDPIGPITTCSFNCVYCQLGEITHLTRQRQIFVPTAQIQTELANFAPWQVDVITLSGSGEPTLALNLGEILTMAKNLTHCRVGVLTNGTFLQDAQVCSELTGADFVAVKVDAMDAKKLQRINRPVFGIEAKDIYSGLQQLRLQYQGYLAIQTMILSSWTGSEQSAYIAMMQAVRPDEIQLNTPRRPKAVTHHIAARENNSAAAAPYTTQQLKTVQQEFLQEFADHLRQTIGIPVRYPDFSGGD